MVSLRLQAGTGRGRDASLTPPAASPPSSADSSSSAMAASPRLKLAPFMPQKDTDTQRAEAEAGEVVAVQREAGRVPQQQVRKPSLLQSATATEQGSAPSAALCCVCRSE